MGRKHRCWPWNKNGTERGPCFLLRIKPSHMILSFSFHNLTSPSHVGHRPSNVSLDPFVFNLNRAHPMEYECWISRTMQIVGLRCLTFWNRDRAQTCPPHAGHSLTTERQTGARLHCFDFELWAPIRMQVMGRRCVSRCIVVSSEIAGGKSWAKGIITYAFSILYCREFLWGVPAMYLIRSNEQAPISILYVLMDELNS